MELCLTVDGRSAVRKGSSPRFEATYDVVVLGLGTAGAEAMRTAVRIGLKALGVEKQGGMGGLGTLGCIAFGPHITDRLRDFERACRTADICYETVVTGCWREGRVLKGVRTLSNGVVRDFGAKMVLDATGNATVARMLGLPLRKGRPFDGLMAPCSRAESWLLPEGSVRPIYRNYTIDLTTTAREYSASALRLAGERHKFFLSSDNAKKRMVRPAAMVGAREECRVEAEETRTLREALEERVFPNPIFHAFGPEDLPVPHDTYAFEAEATQDWKVMCGLPMFGFPATLTYGTIVAKGADNLFVPSKHFGVSHDLGGAIRMQGEMRATGIVAAIAAGIAIRRGCAARDVPYAELKPLIEKEGLLKRPQKTFVTTIGGYAFKPFTDDEAIEALKQDMSRTEEWWYAQAKESPQERAAYGMWTAWKRGMSAAPQERDRFADRLAAEMAAEPKYAGNFAVALALMRDKRAVPVLREIAAHPGGRFDPVVKNAIPNRIKALALLGRFDDVASVPTLMAIVRDDAKSFTAGLVAAHSFQTDQTARFQALSYALMSLSAILEKHPNAALAKELVEWQCRQFSFKGMDSVEISDMLRRVRFKW